MRLRRPRRFAGALAMLLSVLLRTGDAREQDSFELRGTVTDRSTTLPGAAITLVDEQRRQSRKAVTDSDGRFEFGGLPPGGYAVTVTLPGFRSRTRHVELGSAAWTDVSVRLNLSPLEIVDRISFTPPELIRQVPVIAHVRVDATRMPALCSEDGAFDVVQEAAVLWALKGDPQGVIDVQRYLGLECEEGEPIPPLRQPLPPAGSEFVLFLSQYEAGTPYSPWDERFEVHQGQVQTHGFNGLPPVMELEAFKAALRQLLP